MAYFVKFCPISNGEEFLDKVFRPDPEADPDYLRGGPIHGHSTLLL